MQTEQLAALPDFTLLVPAPAAEISAVYCADLLSWAMGRAPAGCAWCTVMGNVNAVAVAHLADVSAIVLCEGAALDSDAEQRAMQQEICVVSTPLPAFQAGLVIAQAAKLYEL